MNFKDLIKNKWLLGVVFFLVYALLINWKFAIVLMVSLGFHESGHVWAMRRKGIKTSGFYFVPLFGGMAVAEEQCKSFSQQAYIAIMGPIWGAALAALTMAVGILTHNTSCCIIASWMAIFNLFNLLPITFLDGGQIIKTIAVSVSPIKGFNIINIVTVLTAIGTWFYFKSFIIPLAAFISVQQCLSEKKEYIENNKSLPKFLNKKEMFYTFASYFITIIVLSLIFLFSLESTYILSGHRSIMIK
jgi:putative peptide zinc metalloprotease protein